MRRFFAVVLTAMVAFASAATQGLPASAETAEDQVRGAVTLMLRDVQTPDGFYLMPLSGSAGGFTVTVPKISVPTQEGQVWDITGVRFEMAPKGGEQVDVKTFAPGSIQLRDNLGKPVLRIALGGWQGAGVFDTGVERFVNFGGDGRNLLAVFVSDQSSISVRGFSILTNFVQTGAGGWTAPLRVQATDLWMQLPDGEEVMRAGELLLRGDATILDWDVLKRRMDTMQSRVTAPAYAELPEDEQETVLLDLIVGLRGLLADFQIGYEVRELAMNVDGDPIQFDRLTMNSDGTGFDQSKFQFRLGYAIDGMTLMIEDLPPDLTPVGSAMTVSLADMPSRAVVDLIAEIAALRRSSPGVDSGDVFLDGLRTLMQNAGSELRIEKLDLVNSLARVEATGQMRPLSTAQYSGVGSFRLLVHGLDPLIQRLVGDPDEEYQGFGLLLGFARAYGVPAENGDPSVLQYDVDVPAEGPVLINGKPFQIPGAE